MKLGYLYERKNYKFVIPDGDLYLAYLGVCNNNAAIPVAYNLQTTASLIKKMPEESLLITYSIWYINIAVLCQ
jgi:hypothetical protein